MSRRGAGTGGPRRRRHKAGAIKDIPALTMFGDLAPQDSQWPKIRQSDLRFAAAVRAAGGHVDVVDLPEIGITGNSHMLMMDKNNAETADLTHGPQ